MNGQRIEKRIQHIHSIRVSFNTSLRAIKPKKGAKGPEDWLPENTDFHCAYINIWVEIKLFWELTVTQEEFDAIEAVSKNC